VVSYGELAARIEHPRAQRAVASALARNRIAVLIPCHRVIRENGDVGNYRWGGDRKQALLAVEAARRVGQSRV
jgi:AraC family transcriptional regulator of adaptative response/methylated-DNA-[protein]-cysteine methyltransferase